MRKLLLISGLLLVVVLVSAQGDYGKFAYGFGVAGGYYSNRYANLGNSASLWSATEYNDSDAYRHRLDYDNASVYRNYQGKSDGFSVRCVRN